MWNLLFITTSLGLCVFVSALCPNDCNNPIINRGIHPKSACVKLERCPRLHKDLKEGYDAIFAEQIIASLSCQNDREKICCPHSWIKNDVPVSTDSCGIPTVIAPVTEKPADPKPEERNEEEEQDDCYSLCKCKWSSGKFTADCAKKNLTYVPTKLSSKIRVLDLTGNHITHLPKKAFIDVYLNNLQKLILRNCGIRAIHIDAFDGLQILIELDLSNNYIKNIHPGTFAETLKIRVLQLNYNSLEGLENNLFANLGFLQRIELSNNHLVRIAEKTFKNIPRLSVLTLNSNNLTSLEFSIFKNLSELSNLELYNNPWNCDCQLKEFRNWVIERKLYTEPTNCSLPENLFGKYWNEVDGNDFACQYKMNIPQSISFDI